MSKYRKFYVALGAFLVVLAQVVSDGVVSAEEAGVVVTALIAALGVFGVPNKVSVPAEVVEIAEAINPSAFDVVEEQTTLDGQPKRSFK